MASHFADRMVQAIQEKQTCLCVGIDPVYSRLPEAIRERKDLNDENDLAASLDAIFEFSRKVLQIVAPLVPAVKINSAFFEKYYWEGVENYYSLIQEADNLGLEVIGDVKRGDIGNSARFYAEGHLKNPEFVDMDFLVSPDAITINGLAGRDGILPFAEVAAAQGKGLFVWVRASNPSAQALQDFADAQGRKWFELFAEQVATLACEKKYIGQTGYSNIGMVVGGTAPEAGQTIRQQYPHIFFLVPGYGSQGASAEDCVSLCKEDGTGALINASRKIIYAYEDPKYIETLGAANWEKCIEQACTDMKEELTNAMAVRQG